jgi:hypothetical protein
VSHSPKYLTQKTNNPSVYYGFTHNEDPSTFVSTLLDKYRSLVEEIYSDGVRQFLFLNCPPTTRSPQVHEENDLPEQFDRHAAMVSAYNDGLIDMAFRFSQDHDDVSTLTFTIKRECKSNVIVNRRLLRLVGFYDTRS